MNVDLISMTVNMSWILNQMDKLQTKIHAKFIESSKLASRQTNFKRTTILLIKSLITFIVVIIL